MNKSHRNLILGSAWTGLGMATCGAILGILALAVAGLALIVAVSVLFTWSKSHKPAWYDALK